MSRVPSLAELLDGPVLEVAPRLLGSTLRHGGAGGADPPVAVRITEVEAYAGADDPGSHAFRGRTERTAVMFGPPGRLYVYFTYGMHHCCNVVVAGEGEAAAVLLRAGEVVEGLEVARARRTSSGGRTPPDRDLARGPARLCQALGIDRRHDGADLTGYEGGRDVERDPAVERGPVVEQGPVVEPGPVLVPGPAVGADAVSSGPRVGLRGAPERPWRFWLTGEATVSTYRPAAPVGRRRS
ncbi:DNA-3-methyladenine glycosylase [Nocardioides sp. HDW12B]|uniref:DNA-3-methyladenine glycosylase n=1 Tax=Nocardioides sp. HDW12B TaxID=2714939 RepID=UPI001409A29E|nr:DNA-3-methyladenine glycosylase [Nocardioides sp. HDW12B]QIK66563.1 DNA-3-methyladenine glycosylase [Nocardioides sp. HDW12B]